MAGKHSKIDELRKENKALKAKNKAKRRKLRHYKSSLADIAKEDPDEEEDGSSEDLAIAKDIEGQ